MFMCTFILHHCTDLITFKKIAFPLIALFLAYRAVELMSVLLAWDEAGYGSIMNTILAAFMTMLVTGVFAFVGFAYPTHRLLPGSYYRIHHAGALKQLYRGLGVEYFKVLLLLMFWGRKKYRKRYFNGTREGLENFIFQTKQSEFGHLGAFIALLIIAIILAVDGNSMAALVISIINVIGNFYPIVLQRFHRIRIAPIVEST